MPYQTAGPGRSALCRGSTVASPRPPKAAAWASQDFGPSLTTAIEPAETKSP